MKLARAVTHPFQTVRALHRAGMLGMNKRNHHYTLRWNSRSRYPLVDDKLRTKLLCDRAGIPTARVLAVARFQAHTRRMLEEIDAMPDFVLKPARGAMGNGILVVRSREGERYVLAGGAVVDREALAYHLSSILSGMFALGGNPDVAFAEERLVVHPDLARLSTDGVPDMRVVVFRGVPVMAMMRLPTRRSGGRANLHQGAVGVGIDLATGRTNHAVIEGELVEAHPDTAEPVVDLPVPDFEVALEIAVRSASETGLGYVGADVVVDARYGALILELNARPGLAIQIANHKGLLPRLQALEHRRDLTDLALKERIALGQELARCS